MPTFDEPDEQKPDLTGPPKSLRGFRRLEDIELVPKPFVEDATVPD
jgi:hypothetical protein